MLRLRHRGKRYVAIILNTNCSCLRHDNLDAKELSRLLICKVFLGIKQGPLSTLHRLYSINVPTILIADCGFKSVAVHEKYCRTNYDRRHSIKVKFILHWNPTEYNAFVKVWVTNFSPDFETWTIRSTCMTHYYKQGLFLFFLTLRTTVHFSEVLK